MRNQRSLPLKGVVVSECQCSFRIVDSLGHERVRGFS